MREKGVQFGDAKLLFHQIFYSGCLASRATNQKISGHSPIIRMGPIWSGPVSVDEGSGGWWFEKYARMTRGTHPPSGGFSHHGARIFPNIEYPLVFIPTLFGLITGSWRLTLR